MQRNYYYLVSGLPDIIIDSGKKVPPVKEFISEAAELISTEDAQLLSLLRYPIDNKNLIGILEEKNGPFDPRGNFSLEDLELAVKAPDNLPEYMQTFIESFKEGKTPYPGLSAEDHLTWLFYDEMKQHKNKFISEWFSFDQGLRNVLAGLNCRKIPSDTEEKGSPFSLQSVIIGHDDVTELIHKSTAQDFSLGPVFPWAEKILSLPDGNLTEHEKAIDDLRWNVLDELTTFTYFRIETVLAFCIKLDIVERWLRLDPETGKERLEKLTEELVSGFHMKEEL